MNAAARDRPEPSVLSHARLDRGEISGSLGDLGTFLPLLLGMASQNGLDFAAALFFAGLFNILTGLAFSVPMAVQPMKAIAAVALTHGLTAPQIAAAGACVSAVVLLLGLTGLVDRAARAVPTAVVRGIQLALGATLAVKGAGLAFGATDWRGPGALVTIAAALLGAAAFRTRRLPSALLLFLAGSALAWWSRPEAAAALSLAPYVPRWSPPSWADAWTVLPVAVVPQIPLTLLNSVVAVCALSKDLFPDRPAEPKPVALSVAAMNLIGAGFGAMPMCHGAGGLAGQYLFGARTNGSILLLGGVKLAVAVAFGATLMPLCRAFPPAILGVMLVCSGVELAKVCRDQTEQPALLTMAVTAVVAYTVNAAAGLAAGLALRLLLSRRA
jgi:hypothetical protein